MLRLLHAKAGIVREPRRSARPPRRGRSRRCLALLSLALLLGGAEASPANDASPGVLLRRARYAVAAGDADTAVTALRALLRSAPHTRHGLEAALLLADLEFSRRDAAMADAVLAEAEKTFPDGDAGAQLLLARGWLALAREDAASATRHFGSVATRGAQRETLELAQLGAAWARLVDGDQPTDTPDALARLASGAAEPALRVAAGMTQARALSARGEHKRALRRLRALRRILRGSSFADDVELAIGIAQLDLGMPSAARRTFARLSRRERRPRPVLVAGSGVTFDDLRLPPPAFAQRLARLYAGRKDRTVGLLAFFVGALDRPAATDAAAAIALADAAIAARKEK